MYLKNTEKLYPKTIVTHHIQEMANSYNHDGNILKTLIDKLSILQPD